MLREFEHKRDRKEDKESLRYGLSLVLRLHRKGRTQKSAGSKCISAELRDIQGFGDSCVPLPGERQRTWKGSPRHRTYCPCMEGVRKIQAM